MNNFDNWWNNFVSFDDEEELNIFYNIKKQDIFTFANEANILTKLSKDITFRLYSDIVDNKLKFFFEWKKCGKLFFKKEIIRKE